MSIMMASTFTISQSDSEEELFRQCGGTVEKESNRDSYYKLHDQDKDNDITVSETKKRKKKGDEDGEAPVLPTAGEDGADSYDEENSNYIGCIVLYIMFGYITGIIAVLFIYFWTFEKYISDINFQWFFIVLMVLLFLIFCRTANRR